MQNWIILFRRLGLKRVVAVAHLPGNLPPESIRQAKERPSAGLEAISRTGVCPFIIARPDGRGLT